MERQRKKQIYISHLCQDDELCRLLQEYPVGIESIEFSIGDSLDRAMEAVEEYKKRIPQMEKYPLLLHGPFLDLNPVSYDSQIAEVSKRRFCQTLQIAKELHAKGVVFHTCFVPAINFLTGWPERQIDFWKEILEQQEREMEIYLENVFDPHWQPLLEIAQGVNHERFGICLDVGHVHAYSQQPVKEWIQNLGPYIKHVHLHDNHGKKDEHLALGKGSLDIIEILQMLERETNVESFTLENAEVVEVIQSLEILKKHLEGSLF